VSKAANDLPQENRNAVHVVPSKWIVDCPTAQMSLGEDADAARSSLMRFPLGVETTRKVEPASVCACAGESRRNATINPKNMTARNVSCIIPPQWCGIAVVGFWLSLVDNWGAAVLFPASHSFFESAGRLVNSRSGHQPAVEIAEEVRGDLHQARTRLNRQDNRSFGSANTRQYIAGIFLLRRQPSFNVHPNGAA